MWKSQEWIPRRRKLQGDLVIVSMQRQSTYHTLTPNDSARWPRFS